MVQPQLTPHAINQLYCHGAEAFSGSVKPILQVLSVKRIQGSAGAAATGPDRYRVVLSDGEYYLQGMLATQLNEYVTNNQLTRDSIIGLKNFVVNEIQNKKIVIILEIELLGNAPKIGVPKHYEEERNAGRVAPCATPNQSAYTSNNPAPAATPPVSNSYIPTGSAVNGNQVPSNIYPISELNPYNTRWTIKVRATTKSEVRNWTNSRGSGKLFSVNFVDSSGEIKATGFNEAVDRFYDLFQDGKVYLVSKGSIKPARKQYSNVQNDYEISLDNQTEVTPCEDDGTTVPSVRYNFIPISHLYEHQKDQLIDIIGVVSESHELQTITSKTTNRQTPKRDILLVDQSDATVRLTLWGQNAENFDGSSHPVVAYKGVRVSDYGGRSLSTINSTFSVVNPDIPEGHTLRGWFDSVGKLKSFQSISSGGGQMVGGDKQTETKLISQIKDERLGQSEKGDFFTIKATILFIRSEGNLWYTACPGENCSKKVIQDAQGWRCEKCQRSYNYCDYRYILSFNVSDSSGNAWLQCFNDTAEIILGTKAEQLNQMRNNGNEEAFKAVFDEANFKTYNFRARAKQEMYNDEMKVRLSVMGVHELNYAQEARRLAELIELY